ncbi:MAG: hypothetical protein ACJ754_08100 [Pyrinomonadaceae bacterium]
MLKLLVFAACERLIIGQDNASSLIALLENINVEVERDMPLEAAIPIKWNIVTLWRRAGQVEQETVYEQRVDIVRKDGEVIGGGTNVFTVSNNHLNYRNQVDMFGMPIGLEGDVTLRLRLKEQEQGDDGWKEWGEYPILITYKVKEGDGEEPTAEATEVG